MNSFKHCCNSKYNIGYFAILIIFLSSINPVFADDAIFITKSDTMHEIVFDGRWSFVTEWKASSLDTLWYGNGTSIHLRTAHQDNFIYIHINAVGDTTPDHKQDKAIVCFDTNNTKLEMAGDKDYCFVSILGEETGHILQGAFKTDNKFEMISSPDGFVGVAGISDQNDRYSKTPHIGYEFRIPTDFVGRSDVYGFYLAVYDAKTNTVYSWPQHIATSSEDIPPPRLWGQMISPDKSLPEFGLPMITLLATMGGIILITKRIKL
jgi:hypothetical protein